MRLVFAACASVLLLACEPVAEAPEIDPSLPRCDLVEVVRVVDGDTIVVELERGEDTVRFIGIDTPETVAPGVPVEPFGPEASDRTKGLLDEGWVCLERDVSDRDQYDRLLRHPWLPDGRLVSEVLVEEGLATVVTFPPDVKYHDSILLPAQERAQDEGAGIWE